MVKHPPYTRLDVSRLESDPGSNPGGPTKICIKMVDRHYIGATIIV